MSHPTELHYDLSGLRVRLRQPPPGWHATMDRWWADFAVGAGADPLLDLIVELTDGPPAPGTPLTVEPLPVDDPGGAGFALPEGTLRIDGSGHGVIELFRGGEQQRCYAVMNLLLAALGHELPRRGAAVFHAAGILVDGAGFLLVGPAGAGKTTFAQLAHAAGAGCLSDDVVFVDAAGERAELLGVPFRADRSRPIGPGRWPLRGLLFPRHGKTARLAPVRRLTAQARLVANLLYLDPAGERGDEVQRLVETLVARVPMHELTFARDASFLPLLRERSVAG